MNPEWLRRFYWPPAPPIQPPRLPIDPGRLRNSPDHFPVYTTPISHSSQPYPGPGRVYRQRTTGDSIDVILSWLTAGIWWAFVVKPKRAWRGPHSTIPVRRSHSRRNRRY